MNKYFVFIMVVFGFSSCEKETFVDYSVENNSASTIMLQGSDIIHSTAIDLAVESGERQVISTWSNRGKNTDLIEPTSMFGSDLIITNSDGDTLLKDYKILSNWISLVDETSGTANHKYVLKISDLDF